MRKLLFGKGIKLFVRGWCFLRCKINRGSKETKLWATEGRKTVIITIKAVLLVWDCQLAQILSVRTKVKDHEIWNEYKGWVERRKNRWNWKMVEWFNRGREKRLKSTGKEGKSSVWSVEMLATGWYFHSITIMWCEKCLKLTTTSWWSIIEICYSRSLNTLYCNYR